jgi:integrin alpha 3
VVVVRSQLIGAQFQLVIQTAVSGDEVGAMFGYDITVADLNNDGFSDLIVGAPFYGDLRSPNMGRIVAYLSDKQSKFNEPPQVVNGRVAGGLFGLAVSSVGDLDLDNFEGNRVSAVFYIYN